MYQAAVVIHILAAIIWLGGTLFLLMVLIPMARKQMDSPGQTTLLLRQTVQRFVPVAWASIVLLVITGIYLATSHWDVGASDFFGGEGHFIRVLQVKTGLVILVIVLSLIHDVVLGPRLMTKMEAARDAGGPPIPPAGRKALLMVARLNLLLVLAILILAVVLTRP